MNSFKIKEGELVRGTRLRFKEGRTVWVVTDLNTFGESRGHNDFVDGGVSVTLTRERPLKGKKPVLLHYTLNGGYNGRALPPVTILKGK